MRDDQEHLQLRTLLVLAIMGLLMVLIVLAKREGYREGFREGKKVGARKVADR